MSPTPVQRVFHVVVAEPSLPLCHAIKKFLVGIAEVRFAQYFDEAVALVKTQAPDIVFASVTKSFDGEALCAHLKKQQLASQVILIFPESESERAHERALAAHSDSYLVTPLKQHNVVPLLRALEQKNKALNHLRVLQSALEKLRNAPPVVQGTTEETNVVDDSFLTRFLPFEVKRSKRYQYPISILLVTLDGLQNKLASATDVKKLHQTIREEMLESLGTLSRDTDLVMELSGDRFLVFLSYTPPEGAVVVAERMVAKLQSLNSIGACSVSIGVASYDAKAEGKTSNVSFASLMKDASDCLKVAQDAGGNRAQAPQAKDKVKKNRIFIG